MNIIDLSFNIEDGMPTCGTAWHPEVLIEPMGNILEVGRNTHRISFGSHTGTHMDAPYHFMPNGNTMEKMKVQDMCGPVEIVDFRRLGIGETVTLSAVKELEIKERMVFVFGWYKYWKTEQYYKDFPYFTNEAIQYLISKGMRFMAMDTPSPDAGSAIGTTEDDSPNHKELLKNDVIIVEYLNNTNMINMDKKYEIMALPLKIVGSDGSPCRVIVREMN